MREHGAKSLISLKNATVMAGEAEGLLALMVLDGFMTRCLAWRSQIRQFRNARAGGDFHGYRVTPNTRIPVGEEVSPCRAASVYCQDPEAFAAESGNCFL